MEHVLAFEVIQEAYKNDTKEWLYQKWLVDDARYEMNFAEYQKKHEPYRKSTEAEKDEILKKWGA